MATAGASQRGVGLLFMVQKFEWEKWKQVGKLKKGIALLIDYDRFWKNKMLYLLFRLRNNHEDTRKNQKNTETNRGRGIKG